MAGRFREMEQPSGCFAGEKKLSYLTVVFPLCIVIFWRKQKHLRKYVVKKAIVYFIIIESLNMDM